MKEAFTTTGKTNWGFAFLTIMNLAKKFSQKVVVLIIETKPIKNEFSEKYYFYILQMSIMTKRVSEALEV